MSESIGYSLVLAFTDDSPSFAFGFEAGRIYEQLLSGAEYVEAPFHLENREVLQRAAVACGGYTLEVEDIGEGWGIAFFTKPSQESAKPGNPFGIRIVR